VSLRDLVESSPTGAAGGMSESESSESDTCLCRFFALLSAAPDVGCASGASVVEVVVVVVVAVVVADEATAASASTLLLSCGLISLCLVGRIDAAGDGCCEAATDGRSNIGRSAFDVFERPPLLFEPLGCARNLSHCSRQSSSSSAVDPALCQNEMVRGV
jgi:hypothetical protein